MGKLDFKGLNEYALSNIDSVLLHYLPNGKKVGHEYQVLNPRRDDKNLGSFSINFNTGAWSDFADNASGQDVISLVAYVKGIGQGEAFKELSDFLNYGNRAALKPNERATKPSKPKKVEEWLHVTPVPSELVNQYEGILNKRHKPSYIWDYRNEQGYKGKIIRFPLRCNNKLLIKLFLFSFPTRYCNSSA